MKYFLHLFFLLFPGISIAQQPEFKTSSEILHEIKNLKVTGSVLYIAAHPDDENTRLISYLTKEKGYRVGYLSLTRGEGGQNLIGDEQGKDLGILRTQELLAARRIDGAEQFFTTAYDFGYSKTPEETFSKWNKEVIMQQVVYLIRSFRPDVIVCRFPTTGEGGHGHHTASAIIAEEAYVLAGDPEKYKGLNLPPWKAKRLVWNTFNFGSRNTTGDDQLKINVGGYNALLGKSYGEIASEARSQHRCQAFGTERKRGDQFEYFKTIKGDEPDKDLLDGVNTTWKDESIIHAIDEIIARYKVEDPSIVIPDLIKLRNEWVTKSGGTFPEAHPFHWKKLNQLILYCAGIYTEVLTLLPATGINDSLSIKWNFICRSDLSVSGMTLKTKSGEMTMEYPGKNIAASTEKKLGGISFFSQPYQFAANHEKQNAPFSPEKILPEFRPEMMAILSVTINGNELKFDIPVSYKHVDPSYGELYHFPVIAPPVTLNFPENIYFLDVLEKKKITLKARSFSSNKNTVIKLVVPEGFKVTPAAVTTDLAMGEEKEIEFTVECLNNKTSAGDFTAIAGVNGTEYMRSLQTIDYDHIPAQLLFTESKVPVRLKNYSLTIRKIGYIPGAGDKTGMVLSELGFQVTYLDPKNITSDMLLQFESVITGVRAFNTLEEMNAIQPLLMEYVKAGGNVLIQYNTAHRLFTSDLGPFPIELSRDRVTEEDAKVTILDKNDPALNYPNKISEKDFEGWVQEYGLYYPGKADDRYRRLVSMADKNSPPLKNSILITDYGKGKFVYTSLSFFRQLPAGIPGATRLFINLISPNKPADQNEIKSLKNNSGN